MAERGSEVRSTSPFSVFLFLCQPITLILLNGRSQRSKKVTERKSGKEKKKRRIKEITHTMIGLCIQSFFKKF